MYWDLVIGQSFAKIMPPQAPASYFLYIQILKTWNNKTL